MFRRTKDGRTQQVGSDPLALPRDPATDRANRTDWQTLGLEERTPPPRLGRQVPTVQAARRRAFTRSGQPGLWREQPVIVQGRRLDAMPEPQIGAGTINRNIRYPNNGIATPGFFSWAANAPDLPAPGPVAAALEPSRVDEYYMSSTFLGLPDSAAWVVAGLERPQPGLQGFQSPPGVMGQPSTGWPVLAPEVPSYGARVPLRRPRGLVTAS